MSCPAPNAAQCERWCCWMVLGVVVQLTGGVEDHCTRLRPALLQHERLCCRATWLVREAAVMLCPGAALADCETWCATVRPK